MPYVIKYLQLTKYIAHNKYTLIHITVKNNLNIKTVWSDKHIIAFLNYFCNSTIPLNLTKLVGVGYRFVQWSNEYLTPYFSIISTDFLLLYISFIPVDSIIDLPKEVIRSING